MNDDRGSVQANLGYADIAAERANVKEQSLRPGSLRDANVNLLREIDTLMDLVGVLEMGLQVILGPDSVTPAGADDYDMAKPSSELAGVIQDSWGRIHNVNSRLRALNDRIDL